MAHDPLTTALRGISNTEMAEVFNELREWKYTTGVLNPNGTFRKYVTTYERDDLNILAIERAFYEEMARRWYRGVVGRGVLSNQG